MCHGAATPWAGSRIRQDEHHVWRDQDTHARAYATLAGEASKRIMANLGGGEATKDGRCLGCHSDDVAADRRGRQFHVEDGVGCEACHGGASDWIRKHTRQRTSHQKNIDRGMYPTDDPQRRAELCLSCHFGTGGKVVTHRLLAAGHPRLVFELDTFTQNQPAHFQVDDDYKARKKSATSAQLWAVGQGVALREYLTAVAGQGTQKGSWMDFALLDCAGCHHPVGTQPVVAAAPNPRVGLPRLSGANFLMFRRVLALIDATAAEQVDRDLLALGQAMSTRGLRPPPTIAAMRDRVAASVVRVSAWPADAVTLRALLPSLLAAEADATYPVAEQQAMAIQSTVATMKERGMLAGDASTRVEQALDRLFAIIRPADFTPATFGSALGDVGRACRE
jgi:hypothetical protein